MLYDFSGSTPPSQSESLKDNQQQKPQQQPTEIKTELDKDASNKASTTVLPPKQHSADDVTQTLAVAQSASTTSLKIPVDHQPKVTTKPPQSPVSISTHPKARSAADRIARQMTTFAPNTNGGSSGSGSDSNGGGGGGDMPRGRSKTISVVREVNRVNRNTQANRSATSFRVPNPPSVSRHGISPNFVFLQLYYTGQLQVTEPPLKVSQENMKAINLLDLIPPFETHHIGVLYVGPGQCNNEAEILRNRFGSVRYVEFLRNLGTLVSLKDAKENNFFINMDSSGSDGKFTYVWKDDVVQVGGGFAFFQDLRVKIWDPYKVQAQSNFGSNFVF